ncbi:Protein of unknown function (DUF3160) [Bernardetia litoralis DSM 6794]|uniref:YARHG domain-containing protein n=1 Tax=Bernardetia litoralis (strain ATCC 23117 / DSM 6794 / NBRC 15988 / NCIMB 1366 / Fx l1 / Sio-4) TaxID=880071 RepID=I4AQ73_BERLS|nr:DUF3160 domain-containing protein [Bernardetia litoralis]AFM06108.1 Protein of unknown function (DUF3160) [Bernardetia litoralis DSM 6794]
MTKNINYSIFLFLLNFVLFVSCDTKQPIQEDNSSDSTSMVTTNLELESKPNEEQIFTSYDKDLLKQDFYDIDLSQDLSTKSLEELRLLRNALVAKQGYLFMNADLRGFFSAQGWYDSLMENRWEQENYDNNNEVKPIALNTEESAFADKIKALEEAKKKENYIEVNGKTVPNINNVINLWQYENVDEGFFRKVAQNGFAIVPNDNIQLFHVYEENDYHQTPNFVTSDMYLQLFHMYFMYVLRTLEEENFSPMLANLCEGLYNANYKLAQNETNPELKEAAEWNSTYFAIAIHLLNQKNKPVIAAHKEFYKQEIAKVMAASNENSEFLDYQTIQFPYSLFKPRGHYTRKKSLQNYFRAMIWIQTVPQCLDDDKHLHRMALNAHFLNTEKSSQGKSLIQLYKGILEPTTFLIGEPDNLSALNIVNLLGEIGIQSPQTLTQKAPLQALRAKLQTLAKTVNKIKPEIQRTCPDKINLMPQRYLVDNEILQRLVEIKDGEATNRPFPKGLDVFAAFGNKAAQKNLVEVYDEANNWKEYMPRLEGLQDKLKDYNEWDEAVYNKWIYTLLGSFEYDKRTPPHLKSDAWDLKTLNTSLASWAELKHDAILYAEQPMAAECGGGGLPEPYTVSYVEPNTVFWKRLLELVDLNTTLLQKHNLFKPFEEKTTQMREQIEFLNGISEKQLAGQKVTQEEYVELEYIGGAVEMFTLSIIDNQLSYLDSWENVTGTDKSIAVVADIYTNNVDKEKKGILHVGVGKVNDIFVIVEIDGYLYLTRGGTFGYHEFVKDLDTRLNDEEWQKILETEDKPSFPKFLEPILYQGKQKPKTNEKVMYSSGC